MRHAKNGRVQLGRKAIDVEIARLRELDVGALRARWHTVFGRRAPAHLPRHLLFRILAYRLQSDHLGDLDPESQRLLDRSESPEKAGQRAASQIRAPVGTVLAREWNGQMQRVTVLENGFAWKGKTYPNLSKIALAITGTRWNGPRFFGLPPDQSSIARALRGYRGTGVARAAVLIPSKEALTQLVASGISHRIDPVHDIHVAAPGEGAEPPPPTNVDNAPIVGVVDGGLHARSYTSAEAWRAPPMVSNSQADRVHGNAISSLVVHGHAWNTNRNLPPLFCRIGTVQAVPHANANRRFDEREAIDYLRAVMQSHPDTHIWSISANQNGSSLDPDEISLFGQELSELARAMNVLPVVSVGNVRLGGGTRPNPPADCEAAIVVGGRQADARGNPAAACPRCLAGPGPDGMLKPDVSWFSQLRMIGGVTATGSSYPTALVSSLAAHTYDHLREPTPDLAKALLINTCELQAFDPNLGWGTPYQGNAPWICAPGTVTLAWKAELQPGANYYWNEIPIPEGLVRNGKLYGKASLTAVLRPLVSPFGLGNYFASRLQTSLRYPVGDDEWKPLLGSMKESTLPGQDARYELLKWQPVRRATKDFTKRGGLNFDGQYLQLYARVFTRDLYQFNLQHHSQLGPQEVAFVLTLSSGTHDGSIYNSMVQELGSFVESAVVDIEVPNE